MELVDEAFTLYSTNDSKSTRLHVACDSNRLLAVYLWLLVRRDVNKDPKALSTRQTRYTRALASVVAEVRPLEDAKTLKSVKHIGPKLTKEIVETLWKAHPPQVAAPPPDAPTEEEQATQTVRDKRDMEETERPRRKTKAKAARKEYRPQTGTVNYAFLITLYQARQQNQEYLLKRDLMALAEVSGLAHRSIYGTDPIVRRRLAQNTGSPLGVFCYTGWSSVKTLLNRDVPLVETFSNPKKVKLTEKGMEVAKELYDEALLNGTIREIALPPAEHCGNGSSCAGSSVNNCQEEMMVGMVPPIEKIESLQLPFLNPSSSFDDEFEVVLLIDIREQFETNLPNSRMGNRTEALTQHLTVLDKMRHAYSIQQLPVGDAMWIARKKVQGKEKAEEYVLDWIVERKRVDDLEASIIDKRYEKQKYWLKLSGLKNFLYVVEGTATFVKRSDAVKTATEATEIFHPFQVFKTKNYHDTLKLYGQITDFVKKIYREQAKDTVLTNVAITMNCFKNRLDEKRKIKCKDIWGLFLTKIPGVGADTAACISDIYPTPLAFYTAFHSPYEDRIKVLAEIKLPSGRKIGNILATNMINFLFTDNNTPNDLNTRTQQA